MVIIMIDLTSFEFSSMFALFVYWIPLSICLTVYFFLAIYAYKYDLEKCTEKFCCPTLTIGIIVAGILVSITPCVNLLALVFACLGSVLRFIGKQLNIPLVRAKKTNETEKT